MVDLTSASGCQLGSCKTSRTHNRLLGAECVDILAAHRVSTVKTLARPAVPDVARPNAPRLPSRPSRSTLLSTGTRRPKTARGSHMTARKPPHHGEVSSRSSSDCCQSCLDRVATRPRQPESLSSEEANHPGVRALEALLHQRVRCFHHHC